MEAHQRSAVTVHYYRDQQICSFCQSYLFISFNCWELAVFLSSPSTLPDLFQFFTGKDMSSVLLAKFGVL